MDAADPLVKLDMRAFVGGNNWINSARGQAKSDIKQRSSARFAAPDSSVTGFRNANQDAWIGAQATIKRAHPAARFGEHFCYTSAQLVR